MLLLYYPCLQGIGYITTGVRVLPLYHRPGIRGPVFVTETRLMKDINEAKTFRKIINAHENFVTRLHTCLLLDRQLHQISKTLFGMFDTAIQVAHTSLLTDQMEKLHISNCMFLQRIFESISQKGGDGKTMAWMAELSNALYYQHDKTTR